MSIPMLSILLCLVPSVWALPPGEPFADLGFDAALERVQKEKKLLLVDFTASWCAPCKKMDRDTWGDAGVRTWLAEHALAIQVDVDREKELAKRFAIEAMPTVVVFREGVEFDRITGYRNAEAFLGWTRDVLAGKRSTDELMERARSLENSADVQARMDLADDLVRAKQYDAALAHYLWLWPESRRHVALSGVRVSFMLADMAELAKKHEPSRKAFIEILDGLQVKIDGEGASLQDWKEWMRMCQYFEEKARIFAWYEKHRDENGLLFGGQPDGSVQPFIVEWVSESLMEEGRVLDAIRLVRDGPARARQLQARYRMLSANNPFLSSDEAERAKGFARDQLRRDVSKLHAALVLADRDDEAEEVAKVLLEELDDAESRLALVRSGIDIVQRQEASFSTWLSEAEASGAGVRVLRNRLEKLPPAK